MENNFSYVEHPGKVVFQDRGGAPVITIDDAVFRTETMKKFLLNLILFCLNRQ